MLDIGWSELLIIGVVALIVVGPKDLPKMFHTLGRFTAKMRTMARDFQRAMDDAAKTAGMDETVRDLKSMTSKKNLGLDALETAASKFEKWDPTKPAMKPSSSTAAPAAGAAAGTTASAATPAPAVAPAPGPHTRALQEKQAAERAARAEAARTKAAGAARPTPTDTPEAAPAPRTRTRAAKPKAAPAPAAKPRAAAAPAAKPKTRKKSEA